MTRSSLRYLTLRGLESMRKNKLMTLASVAVLTVCLTVTGMAWLFSSNVDSLVEYMGEQNEVVVWMVDGATEEQAAEAGKAIRRISGVSEVDYVSGEDVLDIYKGYMEEYESLWEDFEEEGSPFRANYRVVLADLSQMEQIVQQLEAIPGVDQVRDLSGMSDVFLDVQSVIRTVGWMILLMLGLVSLVVIGNTIRLAVNARSTEINIMKYVGATDGYICLPFFVEGLAAGLLAALLSSVILICGYGALVHVSHGLTGFWQTLLGPTVLPLRQVWYKLLGGSVLFGTVVGSLGTAASIRRYLEV